MSDAGLRSTEAGSRLRLRAAALALVAALAGLACGREQLLPRPDPLPAHRESGLTEGELERLADIRRFLGPYEQQVLERSLEQLASDPHLARADTEAALSRALSGFGGAAGFCGRLREELEPLVLTGPEVEGPAALAAVVSIDVAHERWLSEAGRERYPSAAALGRAIRDDALADGALDRDAPLGERGRPLFLTDAAALEASRASAARVVCLPGPAAHSYVVARISRAALDAPLRLPTAADGACRPDFTPAAEGAPSGKTCSGHPEYVTRGHPLAAASRLRLSR